LYYIFFFAIVLWDILFLLCASDLILIPVPKPYKQIWLITIILFAMEILLTLSREKEEDTPSNLVLILLMYFTYCQLWIIVVVKDFYDDFILKRKMKWAKTERFIVK